MVCFVVGAYNTYESGLMFLRLRFFNIVIRQNSLAIAPTKVAACQWLYSYLAGTLVVTDPFDSRIPKLLILGGGRTVSQTKFQFQF